MCNRPLLKRMNDFDASGVGPTTIRKVSYQMDLSDDRRDTILMMGRTTRTEDVELPQLTIVSTLPVKPAQRVVRSSIMCPQDEDTTSRNFTHIAKD